MARLSPPVVIVNATSSGASIEELKGTLRKCTLSIES